MKTISFLLAGVGGQGTILASDVLAAVGLRVGHDVKKSEVHGMAQRGGSVTTFVRWADMVHSPLIGPGEADYMLAFEKLEALRYVQMVCPGGVVLINDHTIAPLSVTSGNDSYPTDQQVRTVLAAASERVFFVPAMALAESLGNPRVNNVVLLGALSHFLGDVPEEAWLQALQERVPARLVELNERAFLLGRSQCSERDQGANP